MRIDNYSSVGWRHSSLPVLGVCLLWAFATTLPAFAQDIKAKQFMAGESFGELKLGMSEKQLEHLLGEPKEKGGLRLVDHGEHRQTWAYQDKSLDVTLSVSKTGAKEVASFTAWSGCELATAKGIKIGSLEADVRKAYGSFEDTENNSTFRRNLLVVGSIHRGIIFAFKEGKVRNIFFGAAADMQL